MSPLELLSHPGWPGRSCQDADPDEFHQQDGERTVAARERLAPTAEFYCRGCPIRRECEAAGRTSGGWGVWGGVLLRTDGWGKTVAVDLLAVAGRSPRAGRGPAPAPSPMTACGTRNGYLRHVRGKEPACEPCMDANAAYRRDRYTGSADRSRAYQRARRVAERRLQEMHPGDWRALIAEEWCPWRDRFAGSGERNKLYNRAWRAASRRLQEAHPVDWRALLAEETDAPRAEAG